jgi:hypothetical protein
MWLYTLYDGSYYNPCIGKAKAGGTSVQSQPGLHSKTLSHIHTYTHTHTHTHTQRERKRESALERNPPCFTVHNQY